VVPGSPDEGEDQGAGKPAFEESVAVARVTALRARFADRDVGAVQHRVAKRLQPIEGGFLYDRLGEGT
jgi:hypothetical protein